MPTPTDLANAALIPLGAEPLESLDDPVETARLVRAVLAGVVDAVLRDHPWNCAIRRAPLARLAVEDGGSFANAFALPADCLRVLDLDGITAPFTVEGRRLLTDQTKVRLRYVGRIGPEEFDSLLAAAVAAKLGATLAYRVTGLNRAAQQDAVQEYERLLVVARGRNGQEGPAQVIDGASWVEVRG